MLDENRSAARVLGHCPTARDERSIRALAAIARITNAVDMKSSVLNHRPPTVTASRICSDTVRDPRTLGLSPKEEPAESSFGEFAAGVDS